MCHLTPNFFSFSQQGQKTKSTTKKLPKCCSNKIKIRGQRRGQFQVTKVNIALGGTEDVVDEGQTAGIVIFCRLVQWTISVPSLNAFYMWTKDLQTTHDELWIKQLPCALFLLSHPQPQPSLEVFALWFKALVLLNDTCASIISGCKSWVWQVDDLLT